jgi:hypothetical protein
MIYGELGRYPLEIDIKSRIILFWAKLLSGRDRGGKMRLLVMNTCLSLNDIMEIRCNKCTRSEQVYDF